MNILYLSGLDLHAEYTEAAAICSKELLSAISQLPGVCVKAIAENIYSKDRKRFWKRGLKYTLRMICKWPCTDPNAECRCFDELNEAMSATHYDALVVSHLPYETVSAAIRYKKEFPSVKLYLYATDPLARETLKHSTILDKLLFFLSKRAEKKTLCQFDCIINMQCNCPKYQRKRYDRYRNKFIYVDFPLIHDLRISASKPVPYYCQKLLILYAGILYREFRAPNYLTEVLEAIADTVNFQMAFYTMGDFEAFLSELSQRDSHFSACGYIPKAEMDALMEKADAYVNIGNKYSTMLPSKLLTYFEQGKPIIHVSNQENDACIPYMEKYPLGLIIHESDPIEVSAKRVSDFLRNTYRQRVSSEEICKIYYQNTPEWSAREIVKVIERDMKNDIVLLC